MVLSVKFVVYIYVCVCVCVCVCVSVLVKERKRIYKAKTKEYLQMCTHSVMKIKKS